MSMRHLAWIGQVTAAAANSGVTASSQVYLDRGPNLDSRPGNVGARLRSHKFSPIEMSLQAADKPRRKRHHCRPQIRRGGVKGRSRRQPVRAAQPLRPLRLISTLHMPCDQPRCDQGVIEAVMARDARPFEGDPGASRLFGGRCRATCPRWRLGAYSACRAFTIASTADSRLLSTMVPG